MRYPDKSRHEIFQEAMKTTKSSLHTYTHYNALCDDVT